MMVYFFFVLFVRSV